MTNNVNSVRPNAPFVVSAEKLGRHSMDKPKSASVTQPQWEEDAAVNVTISDQSRELALTMGGRQEPLAQLTQVAPHSGAGNNSAGINGAISEMARINREAMMSGNQLVMLDWNLGDPQPMPGIAQSTVRVWDLTLQLTLTMRGQVKGQDLEADLRGLTGAYEAVRNNLTANTQGNAQNHVNFLETAFRNKTLFVFEENARRQNWREFGPILNFDEKGEGHFVERDGGPEALQQALEQARAQANSFAETFLRYFNQNGAGAFDFAWAAVSG